MGKIILLYDASELTFKLADHYGNHRCLDRREQMFFLLDWPSHDVFLLLSTPHE